MPEIWREQVNHDIKSLNVASVSKPIPNSKKCQFHWQQMPHLIFYAMTKKIDLNNVNQCSTQIR